MIVILCLLAMVVVVIQVFGKMFIEITDDVDKRNRQQQKEREFQRQLQESIRKGQRRN
ncbi:MAG: hypothetical protein IJI44_02110 [Erysipelotrichaceae bacterium]|nr:hypothetical protein [Erysipelotrichaceae bacterium]